MSSARKEKETWRPPADAPAADAPGACQCCRRAAPECIECASGAGAAAARVEAQIAAAGFAMVHVFDSEPPFAYSVGMTETHGLPEFAVVGRFSPDLIETVCAGVDRLAQVAPDLLRGDAREVTGLVQCLDPAGQVVDTAFGYAPIAPENLTLGAALPMTHAIGRYGPGGFEMRQVVVPDPGLRLPWHEGADLDWTRCRAQLALYAPL